MNTKHVILIFIALSSVCCVNTRKIVQNSVPQKRMGLFLKGIGKYVYIRWKGSSCKQFDLNGPDKDSLSTTMYRDELFDTCNGKKIPYLGRTLLCIKIKKKKIPYFCRFFFAFGKTVWTNVFKPYCAYKNKSLRIAIRHSKLIYMHYHKISKDRVVIGSGFQRISLFKSLSLCKRKNLNK